MKNAGSQCLICKNFIGMKTDTKDFYCEAFKWRIPYDILLGRMPHTKKHAEQGNNIVFEIKEK